DHRGLVPDPERAQQGGHRAWNAGEDARLAGRLSLLVLHLLPPAERLPRARGPVAAEDVRVAPHELVVDAGGHLLDPEEAALLGDAAEEAHLEEEIPQLLLERSEVAPLERVESLVGLLEQIGAERLERLLPVPRAASLGAETRHHGHEPVERFGHE